MTLGSISTNIQYGLTASTARGETGVRFLRISDVGDLGDYVATEPVYADASPDEARKYGVIAGDLLIARSGVSAGRAFVVPEGFEGWAFASYFIRFQLRQGVVEPEFLKFYCQSQMYHAQIYRIARGAAQPNVNSHELAGLQIPLPPRSEQRRIVEILQEAEAVRRLRAEADRKTAELIPAIFQGMFGDPTRNPKGWQAKTLGKLLDGEPQNGLYKPSTDYGSGTPIIRITDFYDGRLTTRAFQRVRVHEMEAARYRLQEGDILLNRVNSMEYLGKSALVEQLEEPTIFESNMMRLSLKRGEVEPRFLIQFLQTGRALGDLRRRAKQAVNQASVNQGDVRSLQVIVPPLQLQRRFVRVAREVEETALLNQGGAPSTRASSDELLASLLAQAFVGKLTAGWREQNANNLAAETHQRDEALQAIGVAPARLPPEPEHEQPERDDGRMSELSSEQRRLYKQLPDRPFTASSLAGEISGPLQSRPEAIRRQLEVLCARGLLLSVKRRRQDSTQRVELAQLYRKPTPEEEGWLEKQMKLLVQSLEGNES
ncbi:MAG: restriction endonuclease subunit S [Verrucomicrobiales bacterium]|nr:restriction endonuclease subunit S [Verrucomicrobiales bacterium]